MKKEKETGKKREKKGEKKKKKKRRGLKKTKKENRIGKFNMNRQTKGVNLRWKDVTEIQTWKKEIIIIRQLTEMG